jgi:hypothetical protein
MGGLSRLRRLLDRRTARQRGGAGALRSDASRQQHGEDTRAHQLTPIQELPSVHGHDLGRATSPASCPSAAVRG